MWGNPGEAVSPESDGRYRFVRQLSEDPIGTVWLAETVDSGTAVTIRVFRDDLVADERFARWLRVELRPVSLLQHPKILDVISSNGGPNGQIRFVVMGAFEGESLAQRLRRAGPLDRSEATAIAAEIQQALDAAHEIGLVHGGVSAHNVLLTNEGGVKLIDFGIPTALWLAARHAHRPPIGSSPESSPQLTGREPDHAHDAHSLELVTQQMLTGDRPAAGDDLPALVQLVLADRPAEPPLAPGTSVARPLAFAAVIVALVATVAIAIISTRSPDRSAEQPGRSTSAPTTAPPPSSSAIGVLVPPVYSLSAMEAEHLLTKKGLVVGGAEPTTGPPGMVIGTDPPTGQVVQPGTPITLLVGAPPDRQDGP